MNLYLDTATSDFLIILFDNSWKIIDHILIENIAKKVDLLIENFNLLLQRNNLNTSKIKSFYLNLGPGFFTGIRISLIFLRTISLLQNQEIYTTSSFKILNFVNPKLNEMYLDAQGGKLFYLNKDQFNKTNYLNNIKIIDSENNQVNKINYYLFVDNFVNSKDIFTEETNILNINPYYIKKPQIGSKK
ncbi:hypothetical protein MBVR141_0319 [Mycoplasmopsis bovirhinis]|uniref:Molecular chaperone n=1 Tax=Mycoplasmopsis bovirhinis TaxID=29553 RepID=A0A224AXC0_9BACT|nr:hypothetical protein [Mycoplasmopsis bovirhinis]BBA22235.1 hypothetical protein MBVR141_0319 [Mycoplasmopsis bovirhinis]VEU63422.1 molecular chaperone [Mycoplasmopsis bovirhinis]